MLNEIKSVLFPTDFSEIAENALHTAIAVCVRHKAELVLVHILEEQHFFISPGVGPAPMDDNEVNKKIHELIVPVIERFKVKVRPVVAVGDPAGEICRLAIAHHVDLVVMGTHGASGLREFFIGSNAYRVVKHAACAVMTVPGPKRWIDFRKILFPIRLVPGALSKYDAIRPFIWKNNASMIVAGIVKKADEGAESVMKQVVAMTHRKMICDSVACSTEVHKTENMADLVLHLCNRREPDLLVITATFEVEGIITNFFLGPYTQQIVNHCKVPVLSIPVDQAMNTKVIDADQLISV